MLVIDSADRLSRRWVLLLVAASPRLNGCSAACSALHCGSFPGGRHWACCTARLVGWPLPSEHLWQLPRNCSEESQKVLGAMLEYARDWAQVGGSAQQWARQILRALLLLRCGLTYHSGASQPLNVACCLLPMNPRLLQEGSITTVFVAHDWNTVERLTGGPHVLASKQAGQYWWGVRSGRTCACGRPIRLTPHGMAGHVDCLA